MTDAPYQPTEAHIEAVLAKYTPRQIAISYLRAKNDARQAGLAFDLMAGLADLQHTFGKGDMKGAEAAVEGMMRKARTAKQIDEAGRG